MYTLDCVGQFNHVTLSCEKPQLVAWTDPPDIANKEFHLSPISSRDSRLNAAYFRPEVSCNIYSTPRLPRAKAMILLSMIKTPS
jgi:hypothetical protein